MEHFEWYLGFVLKATIMLILTYYAIRLAINASNGKFPKFLYNDGKINTRFFIYMVPVMLMMIGVFMQIGTYTDNLMQGKKPEWVKNLSKDNTEDKENSFEDSTKRIAEITDKFSIF